MLIAISVILFSCNGSQEKTSSKNLDTGNPVERLILFEPLTVISNHFPTFGNSKEIVRAECYAKHSGIKRITGMHMRNTP